MPYISVEDRERWNMGLEFLWEHIQSGGISNGDLNYLYSMLARFYLDKHGRSYNTMSDVVKALECAKLEFYRREMAPYENTKLEQNGDVY